ncbi:hypothetical protein G6F35_015292 [Rhizopus arrhizus]|nr:hypothetical protein G6F35_015292 [Rhizopus arrhizus]
MRPVVEAAGIVGQRFDRLAPGLGQATVGGAPHRFLVGRRRHPHPFDVVTEGTQLLGHVAGHLARFVGQQVAEAVLVDRAVGAGNQDLQAAGALGHLVQRQAGRALVDRHVADVMAFVQHQQHVRRRRDQRLAVVAVADRQRRQQQRMVGDHDLRSGARRNPKPAW